MILPHFSFLVLFMNTINGILFNFDEVPPSWRFCFCSGCPKHEECLRYQLGLHVPESMTWGSAVFPTAYKNVVANASHNVGDIAAFGDGTQSSAYHEITQTDGHHIGGVSLPHGIAQSCKTAVSVNLAVSIAFKEYHDALFSL
jgi:hypothetical protein